MSLTDIGSYSIQTVPTHDLEHHRAMPRAGVGRGESGSTEAQRRVFIRGDRRMSYAVRLYDSLLMLMARSFVASLSHVFVKERNSISPQIGYNPGSAWSEVLLLVPSIYTHYTH